MINEPLTKVCKGYKDYPVCYVKDVLSAKQGLEEDIKGAIREAEALEDEDEVYYNGLINGLQFALDNLNEWFPLSDQPLSPSKAKAVDGEQKVGSKEPMDNQGNSPNYCKCGHYNFDHYWDTDRNEIACSVEKCKCNEFSSRGDGR